MEIAIVVAVIGFIIYGITGPGCIISLSPKHFHERGDVSIGL